MNLRIYTLYSDALPILYHSDIQTLSLQSLFTSAYRFAALKGFKLAFENLSFVTTLLD